MSKMQKLCERLWQQVPSNTLYCPSESCVEEMLMPLKTLLSENLHDEADMYQGQEQVKTMEDDI